MKVHSTKRPLSILSVSDGCAYTIPGLSLVQTNLFLRIGCVDELFIKVPSEHGLNDYRAFVEQPETISRWNIRQLEPAERFDRLESSLPAFSSLSSLTEFGAQAVHYLLLFKMQYERLRSQSAVGIPQARFGAIRWTRWGILHRFEPALFQERVRGATLWDMFDSAAWQVLPQWRPFLPAISAQLSKLLNSDIVKHVDWNIKNFIFDETTGRLFYVDQKPTLFVPDHGNELNLRGIREYFTVS